MVTRRDLQEFAQPVVDVYLAIEDEMLMNIAKRIAKYGTLLTEDDIYAWQVENLANLGDLTAENIRIIAKYAGRTAQEIHDMLLQAGYEAVEMVEPLLEQGAQSGVLRPVHTAITDSDGLKAMLTTFEAQAVNIANLTNQTLLTQAPLKYTQLINETAGKVLSGTMTTQQAIRTIARAMAERGVPAMIASNGAQWTPEAYIRTVMRSTLNNVANGMQDERMDEYGCDLVEVSSYLGARPLCAPYQGRIFSRSGASTEYPALDDTSMGEPAGLFGINCGHVKYPYWAGISNQRYTPYDEAENSERYQELQRLRLLEREIRSAKREHALLKRMNPDDTDGLKRINRKVRARQGRIRDYISDTGLTRRRDREQIYM